MKGQNKLKDMEKRLAELRGHKELPLESALRTVVKSPRDQRERSCIKAHEVSDESPRKHIVRSCNDGIDRKISESKTGESQNEEQVHHSVMDFLNKLAADRIKSDESLCQ